MLLINQSLLRRIDGHRRKQGTNALTSRIILTQSLARAWVSGCHDTSIPHNRKH